MLRTYQHAGTATMFRTEASFYAEHRASRNLQNAGIYHTAPLARTISVLQNAGTYQSHNTPCQDHTSIPKCRHLLITQHPLPGSYLYSKMPASISHTAPLARTISVVQNTGTYLSHSTPCQDHICTPKCQHLSITQQPLSGQYLYSKMPAPINHTAPLARTISVLQNTGTYQSHSTPCQDHMCITKYRHLSIAQHPLSGPYLYS